MNGNRSVSLGRQGGWITSISAPMFPAFKPLPKVFLSIAFRCFLRHTQRLAFLPLLRYLSFSGAALLPSAIDSASQSFRNAPSPLASRLGGTFGKESLRAALRGAESIRIAEDIGGKLSFHDCTLLLTRKGRTPYLVRCVAEIAVGRPFAVLNVFVGKRI